jgi:hypothetical protein
MTRAGRGVENGVEQAGEAMLEVIAANGHEAAGALGAGMRDAAVTKELEVVAERRLSHGNVEFAPAVFTTIREGADDLHPDRMAECREHADEVELVDAGVAGRLLDIGIMATVVFVVRRTSNPLEVDDASIRQLAEWRPGSRRWATD